MSIDGRAKGYGTIWSDWTIGELLGHGSGGKTAVYKLTRVNHGFVEEDVLKVVNIIEEDMGMTEMSEDYKNDYLAKERESTEKAESEVNLMHKLRNCNNIVTYQDFKFHHTRDEHLTALDLLIRMHKYTDLSSIIKRKNLTQYEVIKVGIDICTALEGCMKNGIIHRDIKPENIFYDDNQYLLGDFGISRILEHGFMAQTSKGTPPYAAPEQFDSLRQNEGYDHRVDIYSLGLTLYVLVNKGKLPFMDKFGSVNNALTMRLMGNRIPPVEGIHDELNAIILKACEFHSEDRFASATEMKEALQDLERIFRKNGVDNTTASQQETMASQSSYATEPALEAVANKTSYATEPALGAMANKTSYATEPALGAMANKTSYATEPALGAMANKTSYATEPALGAVVSQTSYATEPALGAVVSQTSYATEPALGFVAGQTSYATEPALGAVVSQTSYATEPALGFVAGQTSYATEPALGAVVSQTSYATEPALESVTTPTSYVAEPEPESVASPISQEEEQPVVEVVEKVQPKVIENEEKVKPKKETDYKEAAIKAMKLGDNDKAIAMFERLADQGEGDVMYYEVTSAYPDEMSIKADSSNAVFWFKKCVEHCKDSWLVSLAEYQLGEIYAKGLGVKKDHKTAESYYASSAAKGNPYAKKKFVAGRYIK